MATKTPTVQIYKNVSNEWNWRLVARNGRILADSGESYKTRYGAARAWAGVVAVADYALVESVP